MLGKEIKGLEHLFFQLNSSNSHPKTSSCVYNFGIEIFASMVKTTIPKTKMITTHPFHFRRTFLIIKLNRSKSNQRPKTKSTA